MLEVTRVDLFNSRNRRNRADLSVFLRRARKQQRIFKKNAMLAGIARRTLAYYAQRLPLRLKIF